MSNHTSFRGFTLMEVVIGIAVFAIGMLALGSLQGALTKSMADARVRTIAANLAEEEIESQRAFTQLISGGGAFAFNDIVTGSRVETIDGVNFTITRNVTNLFYNVATDSYSTTTNGAAHATVKQLAVTVTWDAASRDFRGSSEGTTLTSAELGTGSVTVTASIPALVTSASAKIADQLDQDDEDIGPGISYTPGQNPDVIALSLGDNKFKESLLPIPDVIRSDELVETTFDVITYSNVNNNATFLRREEFTSVSCECTLRGPNASNQGRRPVIWAGDEYVRGQFVTKPYGTSANNQQSDLCDTCCRDHHDGGSSAEDHGDTAVNKYGPFKAASEYHTSGTFAGNHKHYREDGVTLAGTGDRYLEACRMVRVNGFFRVAQDFRQEDRYIFPADFLDEDDEVGLYSAYVTGAAAAYEAASSPDYEENPPCIGDNGASCVAEPVMNDPWSDPIDTDADGNPTEFPSWTTLPFGPDNDTTQQLRARGIYIDYLSYDMRTVVDCINSAADEETARNCTSGDVVLDKTGSVNVLELIPFFDVQMTFLHRWNEFPTNQPVDTTNEALADGNTHSRGVISRSATAQSSRVQVKGHRGNLGFTDTVAIDPVYSTYVKQADIEVQSLDSGGNGGPTPPESPILLSGQLRETVPGNPNIIISGLGGAVCDQTSANWECAISTALPNPRVQVSGYGKVGRVRYACAVGLIIQNQTADSNGNASTTFSLLGKAAGNSYHITIQESPCS